MNNLTWAEHIKRAKVNSKFSRSAKIKADSWTTCAVGEKLAAEDMDSNQIENLVWGLFGIEADGVLRHLGMEFTRAVKGDKINKATKIRRAIRKHELSV